jgi:dienelactone hydrolase
MFLKFKNALCPFSVIIILLLLIGCSQESNKSKEHKLLELLGKFPSPPSLEIDTLETTQLELGIRYKIEYTAEKEDTLFNRPIDRIRAYLFVPKHEEDEKLPAIVAIHQDGNRSDLGKLEPAGLGGTPDQFYGIELFKRGYVVICPDRFPHAERRRLENVNLQMPPMMQNISLWMRWAGQMILSGRTYFGKEVYDLMRAVDVLSSFDFIDNEKIGAIGHSAAGNVLVYFMFVDKRIKVGVSSCGFFDLINYYNDKESSFSNSVFAIPNLASIGRSADYLAYIAPRPFLLTRGLWEHGKDNEIEKKLSNEHVLKTKEIENYGRNRYQKLNANEKFQTIYFEGAHVFPIDIREKAYNFIDQYLNP